MSREALGERVDQRGAQVGRLSVQVAEGILRREFSPEDHQRYVDEYLQEVGGGK